ncbi:MULTISPECIES: hypothetical protein [unclassified Streptomyces]|uniref:hypothetical protein n=1 Tax=unclassified Streptomyces TaxID=2593676 RepID=UPI00278C8A78|nr:MULTISPECIES: hypothetical protein [unclassified Streptomyces]
MEVPGQVATPLLRLWCGPTEHPELCVSTLRPQLSSGLPTPSSPLNDQPLLDRLLHLYAWQAFAIVSALTYFMVRRVTLHLPRATGAAFAVWCASTAGTVLYATVLHIGENSTSGPLPYGALPGYLLPPSGFDLARYAAPVTAAALALAILAVQRLRRAHGRTGDDA